MKSSATSFFGNPCVSSLLRGLCYYQWWAHEPWLLLHELPERSTSCLGREMCNLPLSLFFFLPLTSISLSLPPLSLVPPGNCFSSCPGFWYAILNNVWLRCLHSTVNKPDIVFGRIKTLVSATIREYLTLYKFIENGNLFSHSWWDWEVQDQVSPVRASLICSKAVDRQVREKGKGLNILKGGWVLTP